MPVKVFLRYESPCLRQARLLRMNIFSSLRAGPPA